MTVSREQPHWTGAESTTQTSPVHRLVSMASRRMTVMSREVIFRSRLLYPDWPSWRGNSPVRRAPEYRSQRRSDLKPSRADMTAMASSSASLTVTGMLPPGRHGARRGSARSRSSILGNPRRGARQVFAASGADA
ncbi:MAG TPA: hypothetical protein VFO01_04920 [Trebonia sp.]|nr:hypothetical protein [Trebonia sp.]